MSAPPLHAPVEKPVVRAPEAPIEERRRKWIEEERAFQNDARVRGAMEETFPRHAAELWDTWQFVREFDVVNDASLAAGLGIPVERAKPLLVLLNGLDLVSSPDADGTRQVTRQED